MMVCWMNQIEELKIIGVVDESNWRIKKWWCVGWISEELKIIGVVDESNRRIKKWWCVGWIKLMNDGVLDESN